MFVEQHNQSGEGLVSVSAERLSDCLITGNLTFKIVLALEDRRSGTLVGVLKGEDFLEVLEDFCLIFRELGILCELLVFGGGDWAAFLGGDWCSSSPSSSSLVTKTGQLDGGDEEMVSPDPASSDAEGADKEADDEAADEGCCEGCK